MVVSPYPPKMSMYHASHRVGILCSTSSCEVGSSIDLSHSMKITGGFLRARSFEMHTRQLICCPLHVKYSRGYELHAYHHRRSIIMHSWNAQGITHIHPIENMRICVHSAFLIPSFTSKTTWINSSSVLSHCQQLCKSGFEAYMW